MITVNKDENIDKKIFTEEQIKNRIIELAQTISSDYKNENLLIISILRGSIYFTADLTRQISIPINLDFLGIGRYPGEKDESGEVRITKDLDISIADRNVLLIDDIINTGLTHGYLIRNLKPRKPASLHICTLLNNPNRRLVELPIRYTGFKSPDVFLVGYGLDYKENYRHLPYIATLKKHCL